MTDLRPRILELLEMVDWDNEEPDLLRIEVKKDPIPLEALDGALELLRQLDWSHVNWIADLEYDLERQASRLHVERGDEHYHHCDRCNECWREKYPDSDFITEKCPWCQDIVWALEAFFEKLYPHCEQHRDYMLPCTKRCSRCLAPCHAHPTDECPRAVERCGHGVWQDEYCNECAKDTKMFIDGMHKRVVL